MSLGSKTIPEGSYAEVVGIGDSIQIRVLATRTASAQPDDDIVSVERVPFTSFGDRASVGEEEGEGGEEGGLQSDEGPATLPARCQFPLVQAHACLLPRCGPFGFAIVLLCCITFLILACLQGTHPPFH